MNNAFLTGSRAYGTPREDSDVDLVILTSMRDASELLVNADNYEEVKHLHLDGSVSLKYGKLNLIVCYNKDVYDMWVEGTKRLKEVKPVSREQAVSVFNNLGATGGNDYKAPIPQLELTTPPPPPATVKP